MSADLPDFGPLDPGLPLVLLPVRVETRFLYPVRQTPEGTEAEVPVLKVRVFPDDIGIDDQDPTLTEHEHTAGNAFWDTHDGVDDDDPDENDRLRWAAWERFVAEVGQHRALHVATATRNGAPAPGDRTGWVPRAVALPDRWVVTGWVGNDRIFTAVTEPVRQDLVMGPGTLPDGTLGLDRDEEFFLGVEARWLADYDAAVEAGMAVTVDLPPDRFARGVEPPPRIDRLLVFGVRVPDPEDATAGTAAVEGLLNAHFARAMSGFLPVGAATNNLGDDRSAWSPAADLRNLYHRAKAEPEPPSPPPASLAEAGTAAQLAQLAFGLSGVDFGGLPGADQSHGVHARLMAEALFPVTWGEMLGQLILPAELDASRSDTIPRLDRFEDIYEFARDHIVGYVRGGPSLATLRIGRQPYGILPVTDFSRFAPQDGEDGLLGDLIALLGILRNFWDLAAGAANTPVSGAAGLDEAGRRLLQTLGLGAVPHPGAYWVRMVKGELAGKLYSSTHPELFGLTSGAISAGALDRIQHHVTVSAYRSLVGSVLPGVTGSRLAGMELGDSELLRIPIARTTGEGDGRRTPSDYLAKLAQWGGPSTLLMIPEEEQPSDLLYQLVQRSLILANEQSGIAVARPPANRFDDSPWRSLVTQSAEIESLALGDSTYSVTALGATPFAEIARDNWPQLDFDGAPTVNDVITGSFELPVGVALPPMSALFRKTRDAVGALAGKNLDDDTLTRLVGETLSVGTNRLDAWYTSVALRRLDLLRSRRSDGVHVGGFGWVVDLEPDEVRNSLPEGWLDRIGDATDIVTPRDQVGWVHAPSLAQATTGALLRSGELAHGGGGSTVASIDLTSARVRAGAWILDAVRNGQPLGAVLGYRLERLLHERSLPGVNLHRYVDPLRKRYPQRGTVDDDGSDRADQVVPREVVDGVEAWQAWKREDGEPPVTVKPEHETPDGAVRAALDSVFKELDKAVEAVADLLVAEGLHQMADGNPLRAAATFEAVATGAPPPAEIEVIDTPHHGTSVTHRVVVPFAASGDSDWPRDRPRAAVTPALEAWVGRQLGPPSGWPLPVGDGRSITPADLGICALDVVAEAGATGTGMVPLASRVAAAAAVPVETVPVSDAAWQRLLAVAGTLAEVLNSARPLVATDLMAPPESESYRGGEMPPPPHLPAGSLDDAEAALGNLAGTLRSAVVGLDEMLPDDGAAAPPDLDGIRRAVALLADHGIPSAVTAAAATDSELIAAAWAVAEHGAKLCDEAERQLGEGAEEPGGARTAGAGDAEGRLAALQEAATTLLGPSLIVVPALSGGGDLPSGILTTADLGGGEWEGAFVVDDWIESSARVRPALGRVDDFRLASTVAGSPGLDPVVCQLPRRQDAGWVAGTAPPAAEPLVHTVMLTEPGTDIASLTGGLVLDEWTEVLPRPDTTTGLAVHYDAPDARAPQSVLLAVHPDPDNSAQPWSWEMIESMVSDTLDLARLRLVELDQLATTALDEYLPAVYVREGIENVPDLMSLITREIGEFSGAWPAAMLEAHRGGSAT